MPQRVIIEPFRISGSGPTSKSLTPSASTEVAAALADGWKIIQTSSAAVEALSALYVTFVLEKPEPEASKPPYTGF